MGNKDKLIVIFCNTDSEKNAEEIASKLINEKLIACANMISGSKSIYEWQGKIEKREEITLIMKSFQSKFEEVEKAILEVHVDEVPEIIALESSKVHDKYLKWAEDYCVS